MHRFHLRSLFYLLEDSRHPFEWKGRSCKPTASSDPIRADGRIIHGRSFRIKKCFLQLRGVSIHLFFSYLRPLLLKSTILTASLPYKIYRKFRIPPIRAFLLSLIDHIEFKLFCRRMRKQNKIFEKLKKEMKDGKNNLSR